MSNLLTLRGSYLHDNREREFTAFVTVPEYSYVNQVLKSKLISDDLFSQEMIVAGSTNSEVVENAIDLLKIKLSHRVAQEGSFDPHPPDCE